MATERDLVDGVTRVALPVGIHGVETVNAYVLADGERVTLVDPGVWRADPDDDGLAALERGLRGAGFELRDVSRVVVTHAHIDHYGLAGRVLELTGAELWMHAMTDLDCEKYRHPDTAMARRRDMYTDHGVPEPQSAELARHLGRWLPYLYSVVEASRRVRGGERLAVGGRDWELVHTPGHSLGHVCLWSGTDRVLLSGDHLLPGVTPPVTFERGFDADPLRSYLDSLRRIAERPCTVTEIADRLVAKAIRADQRQLALSETLAHIAYLRWSGLVERRTRPDGVYEWYATSADPIPGVAGPGVPVAGLPG